MDKSHMFIKKEIMLYKQVTNHLINTLKRYIGVNYVRYSGDDLNNQQHNAPTLQAYIDDIVFNQFNLTTNLAKVEYQVYILGFPKNQTPDEVLDIQDEAYDVALNVLAYLDTKQEFQGLISVYDYSILTLSHYSAQSNAGVKLSVTLTIPNGVNLCELDEHFRDEVPSGTTDQEITVEEKQEVGELKITKVKLPKSNGC